MSPPRLRSLGANAKVPARLPALQSARVEDPQVQKALEVIREWLEVRLGSRGDPFERAVTKRELEQTLDDTVKPILESLTRLSVAELASLPPLEQGAWVQIGDDLYYCNGKAWRKVQFA